MDRCLRQRRELDILPIALEDHNRIDCLSEELLVEIICRLSCPKTSALCKCVCKRWAALLSEPYFLSRFFACNVGAMKKELQSFAIVARRGTHPINGDTWKGLTMYLKDPISKPKCFTYSSLPCVEVGNGTPPTVVGACNDLLLLCTYGSNKCDLYISNVQTKKWVLLPSQSFCDSTSIIGFICDPYYHFSNKWGNHHDSSNIIVTPRYNYSVVVVPYTHKADTKFNARVFSSKSSNLWRDIILSLPRTCRLFAFTTGFVFGGMLHFLSTEGIVGFDPYDDQSNNGGVIECHLITWPATPFVIGGLCIGVFEGRLHVTNFDHDSRLGVWILKDYRTGEWSLQHSIALLEWVPCNRSLAMHLHTHSFPEFVLGFHPTNSNIIYLLARRWIILCNLSRRTMEVAAHLPTSSGTLHELFYAFPMMLPKWPTPLPTLL